MNIVSTGTMLSQYMEANHITISDIAKFCAVSERTVYRMLNEETKLTPEVASAIEANIPGLKAEFLLKYDTKYQLQKLRFEQQQGIDVDKCIRTFKLKKLFPSIASDKQAMIDRAMKFFGKESLVSGKLNHHLLAPQFSKANNAVEDDSALWLETAYQECLEQYGSEKRVFSPKNFHENFAVIKDYCGTTTLENTRFNMREFCDACGIYFHMRPSIPNARIKGVAGKDEQGRVFILLSDLFKSVEVLWLAFIHECIHIQNEDFNNPALVNETDITRNENHVDSDTMELFVNVKDLGEHVTVKDVLEIAAKTRSPVGIVAAITRFVTNHYSDKEMNSLLHFYS